MEEKYKSNFKNTEEVKKIIKKYKINSLLLALGLAFIPIALIPYLLIAQSETNLRLIVALAVLVVGIILVFVSHFRKNKIIEENNSKYTIPAMSFVDFEKKSRKNIFIKDLIIGILLIVIVGFLYYFLANHTEYLVGKNKKYIYSILIFLVALALFLIFYSKGKKDAYHIFD